MDHHGHITHHNVIMGLLMASQKSIFHLFHYLNSWCGFISQANLETREMRRTIKNINMLPTWYLLLDLAMRQASTCSVSRQKGCRKPCDGWC